ncbi:hypothetical protein E2562_001193 [Oryza meyeriana var. granulata]|uniref:Uncharacterized protein n=1 Tax=Oryza meyeriana var. granulata TaxID=110450 RepID=A0A6G1DBV1_9ORYZ|nr:hypothetical protein E2562_001193 [Oryza meyeriana var. granulata]
MLSGNGNSREDDRWLGLRQWWRSLGPPDLASMTMARLGDGNNYDDRRLGLRRRRRSSGPPDQDEPCSKVNDRKAELKSLGEKAVKRKNYLGASKIYSEALDVDYFDATLYSNRSLCYLQSGEAQKALLDAETCVELRPKWVKGHYREGAALMLLKEHKKAFLNALKLDPANAETEKVLWEAFEAMKKDHAAEEKTLKSVD